jgi:hypothetical protein
MIYYQVSIQISILIKDANFLSLYIVFDKGSLLITAVKLKGGGSDAEARVGMREKNQTSLIQNGGNSRQGKSHV